MLENLKDRSLVVFGVYLRLDHGLYLCLEEFEKEPLIVAPFEVVRRMYDPIDGYSFSTRRFDLDEFFDHREKPKKIVLSTTDGMVDVRSDLYVNKPIYQWFKNHNILTLNIDRTNVRGKAYGGATKYVVFLLKEDELIEVIKLYGDDQKYLWFRELGGEAKDLKNADSVRVLFEKIVAEKNSKASHVEVVDYQKVIEKRYEPFDRERRKVGKRSWLRVHVFGRMLTFLHSWKLKRKNRKAKAEILQPPKDEDRSC